MEPSRLRLDIQNIVTIWLIAGLGYAALILVHTLIMNRGGDASEQTPGAVG